MLHTSIYSIPKRILYSQLFFKFIFLELGTNQTSGFRSVNLSFFSLFVIFYFLSVNSFPVQLSLPGLKSKWAQLLTDLMWTKNKMVWNGNQPSFWTKPVCAMVCKTNLNGAPVTSHKTHNPEVAFATGVNKK